MKMWSFRGEDVLFREYDGIWVAYQKDAGKTHFLNEASVSILDALKGRACSIPEICGRLGGGMPDASGDAEIELVRSHVERLDALGLIERADGAVTP